MARLTCLGAFLLTASFTPSFAKSNANTSRRRTQQVRPTASRRLNRKTGYGIRGDRGDEKNEDIIDAIVDHKSRQLGKGKGSGGTTGGMLDKMKQVRPT